MHLESEGVDTEEDRNENRAEEPIFDYKARRQYSTDETYACRTAASDREGGRGNTLRWWLQVHTVWETMVGVIKSIPTVLTPHW